MSSTEKLRVYLETSLISGYHFGKDSLRKVTSDFFDTCLRREYELYTSDVSLREIDRASPIMREKLHNLIEKFSVGVLAFTEEAYRLAEEYVKRDVVPSKVRADAEHIAVCSVNAIEVLVSWNLRHIVNLRTRIMVKAINTEKGYNTPNIVRPDEVIFGD